MAVVTAALIIIALSTATASITSIPPPAAAPESSDLVHVPFPPQNATVTWSKYEGVVKSTGRAFTGYLAVSDPRTSSVELPSTGCSKLVKATVTSQEHGCVVSTNGAFFDMNAGAPNHCIGDVVANGTEVQLPGGGGVLFGTTASMTFVGYADAATIKSLTPSNVVQGAGWLVRDGAAWVNHSTDLNLTSKFVTEKAPRTAVGITSDGRVAMAVFDGAETVKAGLDLFETAEVLSSPPFSLLHAANIDGGGSSVGIVNGKIATKPTCVDTPIPICERSMATIMCARGQLA